MIALTSIALGCLQEPEGPVIETDGGFVPSRYADEAIFYQAGEVGPCDTENADLPQSCVKEAAMGAPDGKAVLLGQGGVIELFFRAPFGNGAGDDIRFHGDVPSDASPIVEVSSDGVAFANVLATSTDSSGVSSDVFATGVTTVGFVQLTNAGEGLIALDAIEALSAGAAP